MDKETWRHGPSQRDTDPARTRRHGPSLHRATINHSQEGRNKKEQGRKEIRNRYGKGRKDGKWKN